MRVLALLLLLPSLLLAADGKSPNILFAFADDWGRYASIYREIDGQGTPNDVFETPHFDRVAREGIVFRNAHVTAPSCTPCRSSLLSGQYFFRTGRGAILQGAEWDPAIPSYPLLLEKAGYHIGFTAKVWSPGTPANAPYGVKNGFSAKPQQFNGFSQTATRMIAGGTSVEEAKATLIGQAGQAFDRFLAAREKDEPFCYWFGPTNVHRKWIAGSGKRLWGIDPDELEGKMPPFLPDVPVVRQDLADYLGEAAAFDAMLGVLLAKLEASGELENTLVVVSGDHGAPGFPRGKCNLYDFGTNVALAAFWPGKIKPGRRVEDFVNLMDLAPTFLEVGGAPVPKVMTGRSLLPVLLSEKAEGFVDPERTWVITGRERHVAAVRPGGVGYPQRALRTEDHLYIRNFKPERWPMGDPFGVTATETPSTDALTNNTFVTFGDLDASPTKAWMIENRNVEKYRQAYELGFGKRPEEELYLLAEDPHQIRNVASDPVHSELLTELRERLLAELRRVEDPRLAEDVPFEKPPFTDVPDRFRRR